MISQSLGCGIVSVKKRRRTKWRNIYILIARFLKMKQNCVMIRSKIIQIAKVDTLAKNAEDYLFMMKDNYHEFSIGLSTILSCLAMAEKEGAVPKIPYEWWSLINRRY